MASPVERATVTTETSKPPAKRQKKDGPAHTGDLISLDRVISPPPLRRARPSTVACPVPREDVSGSDIFADAYAMDKTNTTGETKKNSTNRLDFIDLTGEGPGSLDDPITIPQPNHKSKQEVGLAFGSPQMNQARSLPSPFRLTSIRDLPASENVDTIGIKDILGDVMIKEAWIFNYLIDLDWVMAQFDPDIKDIVDVKIVHGSWRNEDNNRIRLAEQGKNFKNAKIICAYMPEPFGTHHTKMIILIRHDELAQVIIHTANMIEFDWTNMTQGVWRSPLLPPIQIRDSQSIPTPPGIGQSFKSDLLAYLTAYGKNRTGSLVQGLEKYSFDDVRAVFIASIPGRFHVDGRGSGERWGWMRLKRIMSNIPLHNDPRDPKDSDQGKIVVQVSSIATLGQKNTWLSPVLFKALSASRDSAQVSPHPTSVREPRFSIIFPTAEEVRNSLNGYNSGTAIHTKIESKAQQKQLSYLRPFLCHWDSSSEAQSSAQSPSRTGLSSGRTRAAPHIKTYIRFANQACTKVEWAMLTSANLSTQAWGSSIGNSSGRLMRQGEGEMNISSYEVGVVVYPSLFGDGGEEDVEMIPVFKRDIPDTNSAKGGKVVGLRMPYDLPIREYGENDLPWCAAMSYGELDWMGQSWERG